MGRWTDTLQMYWMHAIAAVLYVIIVWHYVSLGQWLAYYKPMAVGTFGFFCVVASDQVADWTGTFHWSYDSFWTYPPTYVRFFGFVMLAGVLLRGL